MFYIYHIPTFVWKDGSIGKIGVSINPKTRVKNQGYSDFETLETHTDIFEVSKRELELQKQYGYKVDNSYYWETLEAQKHIPTKARVKGGKVSATKSWQENRERQLTKCKKGGLISKQLYSKIILQYDLKNNFIKKWVGMKETARAFNMTASGLSGALNGKQKTWAGYKWKYKED